MAGWTLVPCLVSLRDEFNRLAPGRDKTSDGSIGDPAHAAESSDHNPDETGTTPYEDADNIDEVHAIDVDKDLNRPDWSMRRAVVVIVDRHRNGRDDRLQNVIFDRKIASRSWGWTWRDYTGTNPHDKHAHFSARYTTAQESDTRPWGLLEEDDDMPLTDPEIDKIADRVWAKRLGTSGPTAAVAQQSGYQLLQALTLMAKAEAAEVPASVTQIVEGVKAAFDGPSARETADLLRPLLGDDAVEVGRLLAGG